MLVPRIVITRSGRQKPVYATGPVNNRLQM